MAGTSLTMSRWWWGAMRLCLLASECVSWLLEVHMKVPVPARRPGTGRGGLEGGAGREGQERGWDGYRCVG